MNITQLNKYITDHTNQYFLQKNFIISEITKIDLSSRDFLGDEISMRVNKKIDVLLDENDDSTVLIVFNMFIYLENHGSENPQEVQFVNLKSMTLFEIGKAEGQELISGSTRGLMIHQANIQTTDAVNEILRNSELSGKEIPYEV